MTDLILLAQTALERSYAPYHKQRVGVAVECDLGIHVGCTLENCAYPNSICAVQAAIVNAISSGATRIHSMTVVASQEAEVEPCGRCVQFAAEFGDFPVTCMLEGQADTKTTTNLRNLLRPGMKVPQSQFVSGRSNPLSDTAATEYSLSDGQNSAGLSHDKFEELVRAAIRASYKCYAPVSDFPVGAAILTNNGVVVEGANIEAHVLGTALCAERTAMCKMVSQGLGRPVAIAVVCLRLPDYGRPCGACRQNLVEFGDYPVFQVRLNHEQKTIDVHTTTTHEELPGCFCPKNFDASYD
eukprot:Blabericola_migrator_1__6651@NODE_3358_length_1832_cov_59_501983_g2094_i0_p1_GENE_NODE_3358_length_1832_cov_59_501983_g2094_i0NODE_3358_length_1832_cov_59_501983_g2094_i0_p1_ORF_typecomplete_len298_score15_52dCMP_cyt_deam_2/PF08211_12/8e17dCMP_cyt_deam_2/PF08211_12/2_2e16dCMP_cyt_deam_1/PF00383_23/4_6e09dCMP_cyt_deam_1/PF00383_23/5e14LmjF365940deam/PF14421_6/16LmjF365940deam/PF14421_6/0_95_NODE_3358_length_1832_cov_59_501983_g2094_i084977